MVKNSPTNAGDASSMVRECHQLNGHAFEQTSGGRPCSSNGQESAFNAGDPGSIPGLGRSSGEGNGNALQCSCLENRTGRGAWQTTVRGIAESDTAEWLTLPLQELVEDRGAWRVAVHGVARSWT